MSHPQDPTSHLPPDSDEDGRLLNHSGNACYYKQEDGNSKDIGPHILCDESAGYFGDDSVDYQGDDSISYQEESSSLLVESTADQEVDLSTSHINCPGNSDKPGISDDYFGNCSKPTAYNNYSNSLLVSADHNNDSSIGEDVSADNDANDGNDSADRDDDSLSDYSDYAPRYPPPDYTSFYYFDYKRRPGDLVSISACSLIFVTNQRLANRLSYP